MSNYEIAMLIAVVMGPVLAVQAQKWIEAVRAHSQRQRDIFVTLIQTRGARLSIAHVQALNSIDIAFYGRRPLGLRWQARPERVVVSAWTEYREQLTRPYDKDSFAVWAQKNEDLFIDLLYAMGRCVGYGFERVALQREHYAPVGHATEAAQNQQLRSDLTEILSGARSLAVRMVTDSSGARQASKDGRAA